MAPIANKSTVDVGVKSLESDGPGDPLNNFTNKTEYFLGKSAIDALTTMENMCHDLAPTEKPQAYEIAFNIILPIVCIFGIVGSIFTVIVLSRKAMRTSTNMYLIALASADLIFLVLLTSQQFGGITQLDSNGYQIYLSFSLIFLHIALLASIWMTVALAIERYIAICYPLQASNMCTIFRARCVIIVVYLLSFMCRASQFWEYTVEHNYDPCEKREVVSLGYANLTFNGDYLTALFWIVDGSITAIIPFIALFFLNIRLIVEVRRSSRYLSYSLSSGSTARYVISREEVQITIMLISIVTVFFICEAPIVFFSVITGIHHHQAEMGVAEVLEIMRLVTSLFAAVKCTLNFVLYCWFSEKFWLTFKSMFCVKYIMKKCKSKPANPSRQGSWTNGTATSFLKRSSKDASRETSAM